MALIFDGRVRSGLIAIGRPPHGFGLADYKAYIRLADQWADQWKVSPAQVEFALFSHTGLTPTASKGHG